MRECLVQLVQTVRRKEEHSKYHWEKRWDRFDGSPQAVVSAWGRRLHLQGDKSTVACHCRGTPRPLVDIFFFFSLLVFISGCSKKVRGNT